MKEIEHKLDLILWAIDLNKLPKHRVTDELKELQNIATIRLIRREKDLEVIKEYTELKERMKIIEEDYPNLVK